MSTIHKFKSFLSKLNSSIFGSLNHEDYCSLCPCSLAMPSGWSNFQVSLQGVEYYDKTGLKGVTLASRANGTTTQAYDA